MKAKNSAREKILDTAAFLFQRQGYHATGLNEIIQKSGSPRGSLYYYFPNGKEDLAAEAISLIGDRVQARLEENLRKSEDPVQAIREFLLVLIEMFQNEEGKSSFSLSLLALGTVHHEPLQKASQHIYDRLAETYRQLLANSGFSAEKARELSLVISVMIEGAITMSLIGNTTEPLQVILKQLPRLLQKQ